MNLTSLVTSKGQVTLPISVRKAFKIGTTNRRVRFELCKDGSVKVYPVPDASSLRGAFAHPSRRHDPKDTEKAMAIVARKVAREGLR